MEFRVCIYTEHAYGYALEPSLDLPLIVDIYEEDFEDILGRTYKEYIPHIRVVGAIHLCLREFVKKCMYEDPEVELMIVFERMENGRYEEYTVEPVQRPFSNETWTPDKAIEEFLSTYKLELN